MSYFQGIYLENELTMQVLRGWVTSPYDSDWVELDAHQSSERQWHWESSRLFLPWGACGFLRIPNEDIHRAAKELRQQIQAASDAFGFGCLRRWLFFEGRAPKMSGCSFWLLSNIHKDRGLPMQKEGHTQRGGGT